MSTALLLAIGSRGDTEPFIALASEMVSTSNFSEVHILLDPKYLPLIPDDAAIIPHPLPFTEDDVFSIFKMQFVKAFFTAIITRRFDLIEINIAALATMVRKLVLPITPDLLHLTDRVKPSVILANILGGMVAKTVAELREISFCMVNLQPNTPTSAYPYPLLSTETAIKAAKEVFRMHTDSDVALNNTENLKTFENQQDSIEPSLPFLNTFRQMHGLKEMTRRDIYHLITATSPQVHIINSYSSQLIPPSLDHSENVHIVPPLASSYLPKDWSPEDSCPEIMRFLKSGNKPICVSFGSMSPTVGYNATRSSRNLFTALRTVDAKRVLVLKGGAEIGPHSLSWLWDRDLRSWADSNVFITEEKPQYAWLLPKCSALICHGGAGTTSAGLTAGIPLLISPVLCDQFFWAELLQSMGLGAVAGPSLGETNTDSFVSALKVVLSDDVRERARAFGEEERRRGNGSKHAAELLSSIAQRTDVGLSFAN